MKLRVVLCALAALVLGVVQASAQTPSASLTVQVNPVMIPCDIGPSVPASSIPAEAQLAGFTHCAANWDFSQALYATLSNWFDCDGSNPNVLWHKGSAGVNFENPCNIQQKVDPVAGQKVMNFHWDASYGDAAGSFYQANQIGGWTYNSFNRTSSFDVGNYYIETTSRLEQLCPNCAKNSGGPDDVYTWMTGQTDPDEVDIYEFQTNDAGGGTGVAAGNCCGIPAWTNWGPNKNALPAGYSVLNYYRYGALQTSDGATSKYVCMYINDVLQGAGCASAGSTLNARNNVLVSAGSNAGTSSQNIDMDVGYIRVWSCDAWKTSLCNGTARVTGANGLTYWH